MSASLVSLASLSPDWVASFRLPRIARKHRAPAGRIVRGTAFCVFCPPGVARRTKRSPSSRAPTTIQGTYPYGKDVHGAERRQERGTVPRRGGRAPNPPSHSPLPVATTCRCSRPGTVGHHPDDQSRATAPTTPTARSPHPQLPAAAAGTKAPQAPAVATHTQPPPLRHSVKRRDNVSCSQRMYQEKLRVRQPPPWNVGSCLWCKLFATATTAPAAVIRKPRAPGTWRFRLGAQPLLPIPPPTAWSTRGNTCPVPGELAWCSPRPSTRWADKNASSKESATRVPFASDLTNYGGLGESSRPVPSRPILRRV